MKKQFFAIPLLASCFVTSPSAFAQDLYKKPYSPPTRGFFLEHGDVKTGEHVSIELHSGADNIDNGGGIRLGLTEAELILNSGLSFSSGSSNDALLKWRLPPIKSGEQQTTDQFRWALLTGISVIDFDDSDNDQTNLKVGVSASLDADVATFTISPSLIYSDIGDESDTFFEIGLGAYAGLIDTDSGLFSIGAELNVSTQDDSPLTAGDEGGTSFLLGTRWSYNERVNIDIVPIAFSDNDFLGIPGLVRLNANF